MKKTLFALLLCMGPIICRSQTAPIEVHVGRGATAMLDNMTSENDLAQFVGWVTVPDSMAIFNVEKCWVLPAETKNKPTGKTWALFKKGQNTVSYGRTITHFYRCSEINTKIVAVR